MNRPIALFLATGAAILTLAATTGARAADPVEAHTIKAHVPQTAAARKWADLIARTERGGMTEEDIAAQLDISLATVKRDWRKARAFLFDQLQ